MRFIAAAILALSSTALVAAANPVTLPTKLDKAWQAKTRAMYETIVEIPTVAGRNEVPRLANYVADQLKAAGFPAEDIQILPYDGNHGDKTVNLIARWRAEATPSKKPIMLMAHMDVVEAKRSDWKEDPFEFIEKDGYFYGRGTNDNKAGLMGVLASVLKLKQSGFKPSRDIIIFFSGDEEVGGQGAELASTKWRSLIDSEYALNSDGGGGAFMKDGRPLGYALQTAEKTFQTYFFTVRNRGGHSSRPRPDNAIYELADALKKLQKHRFQPMQNETSRAYFAARAQQEGNSPLGQAIRKWLANPNDQEAADAIENDELETGLTRTRCVATLLEGGHADNALPQSAKAGVNCRIFPGVSPDAVQAELQAAVGKKVEITKDPAYTGSATDASPLRPDIMAAYTKAVRAIHGGGVPVVPYMSAGATDGLFFRGVGIPVYGIDGTWGISPDDERAHGLDERVPVRALYDNVVFWESVLKDLAGK